MSIYFDDKKNAEAIMRGNIERDAVGSKLTADAKDRAINFAVSVWKGDMPNGEAAQMGIKHVTGEIFNYE